MTRVYSKPPGGYRCDDAALSQAARFRCPLSSECQTARQELSGPTRRFFQENHNVDNAGSLGSAGTFAPRFVPLPPRRPDQQGQAPSGWPGCPAWFHMHRYPERRAPQTRFSIHGKEPSALPRKAMAGHFHPALSHPGDARRQTFPMPGTWQQFI